jgi:hypothetical protein
MSSDLRTLGVVRLDVEARQGGYPDLLSADILGWLNEARTLLCWVWGLTPKVTDAAVSAVRMADRQLERDAVSFSDASPDSCLAALLDVQGTTRPVTWVQLRRFLHREGRRLILLDGLDGAALHDLRIRLLLRNAADGRPLDTRILVAAPALPPEDLLPPRLIQGVTVIAAGAADTLTTAGTVAAQLRAARQGDNGRPDSHTTLDADTDAVEGAIAHKLAAGNVRGAVDDYWVRLGNFSTMRPRGQLHLGARICRALNGGGDPDRVDAALMESGWATPVVNDWGQFARCLGNVPTAVQAALTAHRIGTDEVRPWDAALLARHVCEALIMGGDLSAATEWAETARRHAVIGLRQVEGLPTAESMGGVDDAAAAAIKLAALFEGADGIERELDALAEIHARQRRVLEDANRAPLPLPFSGPTGPVDREALLYGWPAALAAVLRRDAEGARRLLDRRVTPSVREAETLLPRVLLAEGAVYQAEELLSSLRATAEAADDADAMCELAVIRARAQLAGSRALDAEADVEEHLWLAATLGLGIRWIDLMVVQSEVLRALGRIDEARRSAEVALHGVPTESLRGALDSGSRYRTGALAAVEALRATGAEPVSEVIATIAAQAPVAAPRSSTRTRPDRPDPDVIYATEKDRRADLHRAARQVIDEYIHHGTPFVLYLRKFGDVVAHGPMEFGPQLLENSLRAELPEGANMVTVQELRKFSDVEYSGGGTFVDRGAPALILSDKEWQDVVEVLIGHAALIVSECLMLSSGVRFELETAYRLRRWDRTVLVLPPLDGPYGVIDSDPVVQMFPRCVWASAFHTKPLIEQDVIKDLVARIRAILELPEDVRRDLVDREAIDDEYPVTLMPLAKLYENDVLVELTFGDQDDERIRYNAFWKLFRANSIRMIAWLGGDRSEENRFHMGEDYLRMSAATLEMEEEEGLIVVRGDLVFAEQCARSAYALLADEPDLVRAEAERQLAKVQNVQRAMKTHPDRFVLRPRYGPFTVRKEGMGTDPSMGSA